MKNALLALALFAFVGTAAASGEKDGKATKAGKKEACSTEMKAACAEKGATAATPSCCMKKGAKTSTAAVTPAAPAATTPVQKSL
ncbi:hypothetical protein LJY25_07230 [Hymenobacter sp. BT175]|uniref:hypothetical protein n=1 Tax=Hymenobacter translucens TaxID=2886507 RepID=UPI001D0E707D|nr:hypothetical protein [Hymenobacter translucens]MCC2546232.1 hypothetical protein [Hymenobacter translucens]